MKEKYVVKNRKELVKIINELDPDSDLNYLDVSKIEDMSCIFKDSKFNGDISNWNVSNVKYAKKFFIQVK